MSEQNWDTISEKLRAPFDPADVDWRPQGNPKAGGNCQVVCYVDARAVMDRLDDVVGAGNWSFAYEPLVIANGQVQIAKGRLSIHGVSKEDVGEASNFDASKGCVSDALKRAAVQWGIGRYLYDVPSTWVTMDQHNHIPAAKLAELRAQLSGRHDTPVERERVVQQHRAPTPIRGAASLTDLKWDFLKDRKFRDVCDSLGYRTLDEVNRLVDAACGGPEAPVDREKVRTHVARLLAKQKAGEPA